MAKTKLEIDIDDSIRELEALVYAFKHRYQTGLRQLRSQQKIKIDIKESQQDLTATRIAAAKVIRNVATVQKAMEDWVEE